MASGLCAALTGRTHGCTDQPANVKKTLANSEPSTHGTKRTCPLLGAKQTPASDFAIAILRAHLLGDRENGR